MPIQQTKPNRLPLAAMVLLLLLPACVAAPTYDDRSVLAGTQRVLALDFGRKATSRRMSTLRQLPRMAGIEMKRARDLLALNKNTTLARAAGNELQRTRHLSSQATGVFASEWKRRPKWPTGVVPTAFEFSRNTANNLDGAIMFLGFDKRPMGELSDKRHRTDHRDVQPEATLWERLRRRLPF